MNGSDYEKKCLVGPVMGCGALCYYVCNLSREMLGKQKNNFSFSTSYFPSLPLIRPRFWPKHSLSGFFMHDMVMGQMQVRSHITLWAEIMQFIEYVACRFC